MVWRKEFINKFMLKIAHIINPAKIKKTSDLYLAQPVTFETMRIAKEFAKIMLM